MAAAGSSGDASQLAGSSGDAVEQDIWIPGATQPGEQQHVEAVASEVFVLKQIKDVIELRETWLRQNNLPLDCQMDELERKDFLTWAKEQYHTSEDQKTRQRIDFDTGGKQKMRHGMKLRWNRELQRRLGTGPLWYMVSFTGRFDAE